MSTINCDGTTCNFICSISLQLFNVNCINGCTLNIINCNNQTINDNTTLLLLNKLDEIDNVVDTHIIVITI